MVDDELVLTVDAVSTQFALVTPAPVVAHQVQPERAVTLRAVGPQLVVDILSEAT